MGLNILEDVRSLFHDVNIVIIIFVFLLVFVVKDDLLIPIIDVGLKNFVRCMGEANPIIGLVIEIMETNVWIPIRYANIVSFIF